MYWQTHARTHAHTVNHWPQEFKSNTNEEIWTPRALTCSFQNCHHTDIQTNFVTPSLTPANKETLINQKQLAVQHLWMHTTSAQVLCIKAALPSSKHEGTQLQLKTILFRFVSYNSMLSKKSNRTTQTEQMWADSFHGVLSSGIMCTTSPNNTMFQRQIWFDDFVTTCYSKWTNYKFNNLNTNGMLSAPLQISRIKKNKR